MPVGQVGELLVSSNGVAWGSAKSGVTTNLNAALFADGKWVAVGDGGTITTSTNGTDWSVTKTGGQRLAAITWGKGSFLAVGGQENIVGDRYVSFVSTNGFDWTSVNIPNASGTPWRSAAFGSGRFVVSASGVLLTSSADPTDWSSIEIPTSGYGFQRIVTSSRGFVATSGSDTETSAGAWESSDGITWTFRILSEESFGWDQSFTGIAEGTEGFIFVGGPFDSSTPRFGPSILFSPNLESFEPVLEKRTDYLAAMSFAGEYFFAVHPKPWPQSQTNGNGMTFWRSKTGAEWEVFPGPGVGDFLPPEHGNGVYVTVGKSGQIGVSTNATDWNPINPISTNDLKDLAFAAGTFVAVGNESTILVSTNGTNWQQVSASVPYDTALGSVAWNNGIWLTVGLPKDSEGHYTANGITLRSSDAKSWTQVATNGPLAQIVPWKSGFYSSEKWTSTDGSVWNPTTTNPPSWFKLLAAAQDHLIGITWHDNLIPPKVLASEDGTNWSEIQMPFEATSRPRGYFGSFEGVAFGRNTWAIDFSFGYIVQSEPLIPQAPTLVEPPHTVFGGPGTNVALRIRALGSSPLFYQWKRNGQPVIAATNQFLTLSASEDPMATFSVVVSNSVGQIESTAVSVNSASPAILRVTNDFADYIGVKGTPGRRYRIERAYSLGESAAWTSAGEALCDTEGWVYVLPVAVPEGTNHFYRAVLVR